MASSKRSTARAKSSAITSRAPTTTSTSSRTTSTSNTKHTVVIAIGSNLGDRRYNVARAVHAIGSLMRVVRISTIIETAPVDAPAGSPSFLNAVAVGYTSLHPEELIRALLAIETRLGRAPRRSRNEPRVIDLDLIAYGAMRLRSQSLTLPHPRARLRAFVMQPLRECSEALARYVEG